MKTVLFACVHNAGRSQMAAALFNALVDPTRARAISAGTQPGDRRPSRGPDDDAEVDIDLLNARPTLLTEEVARGASLLVTMGCGDRVRWFPVFRGRTGLWTIPRAVRPRRSGVSATTFATV